MKKLIFLTSLAAGLLVATAGLKAQDAATNAPLPAGVTNTDNAIPTPDQAQPADQTPQPADDAVPPPPDATATPPALMTPAPTPAPAVVPAPTADVAPAPMTTPAPIPSNVPQGTTADKGLRFNFVNVPLQQVLTYMSDAAGFIIHPKVDISGKVTLLSSQPVSKEEAVKLLKQMLNDNGYTAIQDDRTLTIVSIREANRSDPLVDIGAEPSKIPKTSDFRTQIVPVHSLNVVQLIKELEPLRTSDTTLQADEAANSVVITGPQSGIRHLMEIIAALDSVNSASATVKVFTLKYADAKDLATMIKDLFPSPDAQAGGGTGRGAFGRFGRGGGGGGGGFPFGGFGGGGGGDTSGDSNGHTPTAKVTATSDDHANALIVSAPDSLIDTISQLVSSLDIAVEDETVVKIFQLKNADPGETADELTQLFPDDTSPTGTATGGGFRAFGFGGFGGFGGGGRGNTAASTSSDHAKKMSHVSAVPDKRTTSLIVTAGKDLMPEIEGIIAGLDARDDGKMKVTVIPLANADPVDVQQILQDMFPSGNNNSRSSQANSAQSNPLLNRSQTILQQQNNTTTSSFGSPSSGGSGRSGF